MQRFVEVGVAIGTEQIAAVGTLEAKRFGPGGVGILHDNRLCRLALSVLFSSDAAGPVGANDLETSETTSVAFGRRYQQLRIDLDHRCGAVAAADNLKGVIGAAGNVGIRRHARGRGTPNDIRCGGCSLVGSRSNSIGELHLLGHLGEGRHRKQMVEASG